MEHFLPYVAIAFAGLIIGAFSVASRKQRDPRRALGLVSERLALPVFESRSATHIRGTVDGFEVEIESRLSLRDSDAVATISVRGGEIPKTLTIGATDAWSVIGRLFDAERVYTFDGGFDAEITVQGDEVQATALLDEETRRHVLRAVRGRGATVFLGRVYVELGGEVALVEHAERFVDQVREMIALAGALSIQGRSITERLEKNAAEDRNLAVRHKNLALLLEEFPESPAAVRASRAALEDASHDLRLLGAIHLGAEGFEALASIAENESTPEEIRVRAVVAISKKHARERALPVLERVLASSSYAVRIQAVSAMAALDHYPEAQRRRLEEMIASADPHAIRAVAKLLDTPSFRAIAGEAGFEPILVELLAQDSAIAVVAIEALARIGTVSAVEPLLAFTRRIFVDSALKIAAREAIESIQARIDGGDRGRLSLAGESDTEGALSIDDQRGNVSLPKR